MKFDEAIRRSIESYWDGSEPEQTYKNGKGRPKYTKKYFDKFEAKQFNSTLSEDEFNAS